MEKKIKEFIVGQDEAVKELAKIFMKIVSGFKTSDLGIIDSVFLAGPSGVGKTESVMVMAKLIMQDAVSVEKIKPPLISDSVILEKIIKIECGNFQHEHEVAKIIGAPPGYIGFETNHGLLHKKNS